MRAIITALFLILFSQSAGAEKSGYLISAYSCGTYLSYCETETGCMVGTNWINGFLSAASLYGKPIRPVDGESVQFAGIKYCKENPLKNIYDAAEYIYEQLSE